MAFSKTSVGAGGSANAASPAPGVTKGSTGPGGWEPTVIWLMGLCIGEIVLVALISRHLLKG